MRPDAERIISHCRPDAGRDACRYFLATAKRPPRCLKHHRDARIVIDFRVAKGTMAACGDNCAGLGGDNGETV